MDREQLHGMIATTFGPSLHHELLCDTPYWAIGAGGGIRWSNAAEAMYYRV